MPNVDSALRPVPHDESLLISNTPATLSHSDDQGENKIQGNSYQNNDPDFAPSMSSMPSLIIQEQLHDLVTDLRPSKTQSCLLYTSRCV